MKFQQLEPVSKKDRIVEALREAIIRGDLEPGTLLVETRIAQQFGVGQPLVREALIELEHAGFVQRVPYRGTYVTKLSAEDIENIFRLRAELEGIAAAWAKERATLKEIAELRKLVTRMQRSAEDLDLERFYEDDLAFHRAIWKIAGNPYLTESLERVVIPLFAFFVMKNPRVRGTYEESARAHAKIVDAFESSDAVTVRELMRTALLQFKNEWDARAPERDASKDPECKT
jgi:DNA-binding GntR family transcriptional regulator